ncbi:MAG: adenylosuccinate lyase, partial [Planctomycetota bacterium]
MDRSDSDYASPLVTRYAGQEQRELFSQRRRASTWRELWIALAEAQQELGLAIKPEQVAQLKAKKD